MMRVLLITIFVLFCFGFLLSFVVRNLSDTSLTLGPAVVTLTLYHGDDIFLSNRQGGFKFIS